MSYFDFKQFRIYHDECAMKVGTDAVLLGAWCPIMNARRILDIGTGSGIIALMLAQRTDAKIVGVELDKEAAIQAQENAQRSKFSSRVQVVHSDIVHYKPEEKFDLIVSNPPFFSSSLISPNKQRSLARHADTLPLESLAKTAHQLLEPDGLFCVILPNDIADKFVNICIVNHFTPIKIVSVLTTITKPCKRKLLCFKKGVHPDHLLCETLVLTTNNGQRSDAYNKLTEDFYL